MFNPKKISKMGQNLICGGFHTYTRKQPKEDVEIMKSDVLDIKVSNNGRGYIVSFLTTKGTRSFEAETLPASFEMAQKWFNSLADD